MTKKMTKMNNSQDEEHIRKFTKQILKGRTFSGTFYNKCYAEPLKTNLEVIQLSTNESQLIHDLELISDRLKGLYGEDFWCSLTTSGAMGTPSDYCIWGHVVGTSPDQLHYKIVEVEIASDKMILFIASQSQIAKPNLSIDYTKWLTFLETFYSKIEIPEWLTVWNILLACKYLAVLTVALITTCVYFIRDFSDYLLKFLDRLTAVLKCITPVAIALINGVVAVIHGVLSLLNGMWRSTVQQPVQPVYQLHVNEDQMRSWSQRKIMPNRSR